MWKQADRFLELTPGSVKDLVLKSMMEGLAQDGSAATVYCPKSDNLSLTHTVEEEN